MIRISNGETNFPHKLLTDTQAFKICKGFANGLSANIKFSKTHLSKMIQFGGILGDLIGAIPQVLFLKGKEALQKVIPLAPKLAPVLAGNGTEYYNKKILSSKDPGITLTMK